MKTPQPRFSTDDVVMNELPQLSRREREVMDCRRRGSWPVETVALWSALVLTAGFPAVLGGQGPTFELQGPILLPQPLALTADVRWLDEDRLLLGVEGSGVYSWRIGDDEGTLEASLAGAGGYYRGFESYSRVGGSSSGSVAFAGGLFGVYLKSRGDFEMLKAIEIVGDVDRRGDRTAVVGLSRNEVGDWEDHIAWVFKDGESEPRTLLPTRDGGEIMGQCWHAEVSVVRLISEERVLVVPGLEPGVFVYDRAGQLLESVGADTFAADAGCGLEEGERSLLGNAAFTIEWMAGRRVIDELLADEAGNVYFFVRHVPGGPESIVLEPPESGADTQPAAGASGQATVVSGRTDAGGATILTTVRGFTRGAENHSSTYDAAHPPLGRVCWDLVQARAEELTAVTTLPCAVESEFADTRLRADLRGDKAVVLLTGLPAALARPALVFEARLRPPGR